jgi:putative serine protease PepD
VPSPSAQPDPWQVPGATTPLPAAPGAGPVGPDGPSWGTWTESIGEQPPHERRESRGPRWWVWPAVAALALVVGLGGGVAGSVLHENLTEPDPVAGTVEGGLGDVDTVSLPPLTGDDSSIAAVAQELLPSTVQISAELDGQPNGATGSGFVLDRQGHVVTNNHVIAGAAADGGEIQVVDQEGNRYDATVVGRSPVYDLAVLYSEDVADLEPAALGYSQRLRIGEGVVAIGSPLGLSSTVTAGIVSALQRPVTTGDPGNESSYINAVQTDAAINPGNSGGPLVNLLGQVVGVNSAIATNGGASGEAGNIGVGFAIPVEQVRITADQILRDGEARYPVIGAQVQTGARDGLGAEISEVNPDTPAEEAGLLAGDVVTAVDGDRVTDGVGLIVAIRTHQPGETVEFTVTRDGGEEQVAVVLGSEVG